MRSYIIVDENHASELKSEIPFIALKAKIRGQMIQKLSEEWNALDRMIQQDSWCSREYYEEQDHLAEMCQEQVYEAVEEAKYKNPHITKEELRVLRQNAEDSFYEEINKKDQEAITRKQVIEELLSDLGARMARPYEHWNEMESHMEYSESRHDNQDW